MKSIVFKEAKASKAGELRSYFRGRSEFYTILMGESVSRMTVLKAHAILILMLLAVGLAENSVGAAMLLTGLAGLMGGTFRRKGGEL
ncbi:MAG: hypothetical protein PUF37_05320 [Prevotellaceae bacterium]|nr:hypothetical protein [Prevotellaceae bacterium]